LELQQRPQGKTYIVKLLTPKVLWHPERTYPPRDSRVKAGIRKSDWAQPTVYCREPGYVKTLCLCYLWIFEAQRLFLKITKV